MASFTTKYPFIVNKLINQISIISNGKSLSCYALWDTGASCTCISNTLVSNLKLIPTSQAIMQTPNGSSIVNRYLVDIVLPNRVIKKDVIVCESKIKSQGFDVLIGMDIITSGDFSVSNFGKTVFSFRIPSQETTDYVHQERLKRIIGPRHGKGKK
ncbi:MAG: aspartyl protease family protein [Bacilli bacterium]|nr:aspartyl protease family protein [Bacilli bacterium]